MLERIATLAYEASAWTVFFTTHLLWSLRVTGRHNIPKNGPVLFIGNHQSFLDPPTMAVGVMPRHVAYLARKTLFHHPMFGKYIAAMNAVPVDQEGVAKDGMRAILAKLDAGWPVLLFPEGGRCDDGKLAPLKPGMLLLVKRVQCPIVPVGIMGAFAAWSRFQKLPKPSPLFLPPTDRCLAVAYGTPRDPGSLANMSREEMLQTLASDIAAQMVEAEKIRRKPRVRSGV